MAPGNRQRKVLWKTFSVQNLYFNVLTALLKDTISIQTLTHSLPSSQASQRQWGKLPHTFFIFLYTKDSNPLDPTILIPLFVEGGSVCLGLFLC